MCQECTQSITNNQPVQYLDFYLKYNFNFEKCINYFGRLQKSNVFGGKSLVGQVVVVEMSQTIKIHNASYHQDFKKMSWAWAWLNQNNLFCLDRPYLWLLSSDGWIQMMKISGSFSADSTFMVVGHFCCKYIFFMWPWNFNLNSLTCFRYVFSCCNSTLRIFCSTCNWARWSW